jgi:acyl-CoA thioesterase FadM/ribosomal protein S13
VRWPPTIPVKRALTDPRLFDGIGNAYSDEILHAARLSPLRLTTQLTPEESERLFRAVKQTLTYWIDRLRTETGDAFPEKVTAFRPGMAVHGRFRKPCPVCASPVQRIRYAENEVNYCARCQTGGRLLADRSLSRLLKQDWPRSLDEWEERAGRLAGGATGAGESFGMESQPVRFERTFAVTADDIDGLGHVNNVVYLRWVQDVAAAHWESATTPAERADIGWVVLRHEIDYQHSAKPGDQVIVRTWVGPPNAATFERHTEILRAADQRVLARARSLWCPVHPRSGRVRRIDPALHDRFYAR